MQTIFINFIKIKLDSEIINIEYDDLQHLNQIQSCF